MEKIWVKCSELGGSMHVGELTITGYFPVQAPKSPAVMEAIGMGRLKELNEKDATAELVKAKANVATMTTAAAVPPTNEDKEAEEKAKVEAEEKAKAAAAKKA